MPILTLKKTKESLNYVVFRLDQKVEGQRKSGETTQIDVIAGGGFHLAKSIAGNAVEVTLTISEEKKK